MSKLTDRQLRAVELMLEQQDRFNPFLQYRIQHSQVYEIVEEFYDSETRSGQFELLILNKIGALLAPDSTEDLNLTVRI